MKTLGQILLLVCCIAIDSSAQNESRVWLSDFNAWVSGTGTVLSESEQASFFTSCKASVPAQSPVEADYVVLLGPASNGVPSFAVLRSDKQIVAAAATADFAESVSEACKRIVGDRRGRDTESSSRDTKKEPDPLVSAFEAELSLTKNQADKALLCPVPFDTTFVVLPKDGTMMFYPHMMTPSQQQWLLQKGRAKYSGLCQSPDDAFYLIAITRGVSLVSGVTIVMQSNTSRSQSSVEGTASTMKGSANITGTIDTTTHSYSWVPVPYVQQQEDVYAYVFSIPRHTALVTMHADKMPAPLFVAHSKGYGGELGQGRTLFERSMESAERATFEDALRFVARQPRN